MKPLVYISIYKQDELLGVMTLDGELDHTKFIDSLHDNQYVIKPISKKEYNDYNEGDELTPDDIKKGNYIKTFENFRSMQYSGGDVTKMPVIGTLKQRR